jgi:glycosyltransferase involved in cell wall biosynthesis
MHVWYLVFVADSLTYTIARALSEGGHEVSVYPVSLPRETRRPDAIQRRLMDTPRVRFVDPRDLALPGDIERLIVQVFPRPAESLVDVGRLASCARRISLITAGDRSRSWRTANELQWREAKRLARHAARVDRVLYKDGWYRRDLLGLVKPRDVVGFDVHSQFLHDQALYDAMHARDWDPQSRRKYRVNFLGSQDPASRKAVLDAVRPLFASADPGRATGKAGPPMFWHEYSDADPVGVPPHEFVRLLTESDFTLCPRGYSLVTHRPVEALLRGSIPVLAREELDLYGIDLVDGENCIGVPAGGWADTVRRLLDIDSEEVLRLRSNAFAMFERCLAYDALARRLRRRIGVPDGVA